MEELDKVLLDSLNKYFDIVSIIGYVKEYDVKRLLIISAILYILDNYLSYITDEDLKSMIRVVYCINGDCLINLPDYINDDDLFKYIKVNYDFRIAEDNILRLTEDELLRIKD